MKRTGQSKIAVVGWGRGMGHTGHMYLASAVITQAKMMHADPYFFVSKTVGKDDPLFPEEKVKIYQRVFPQQATIFSAEGNLNEALTQIAGLGYQGVVVVVGADQKNAFQYLEKPNKEGVPVYQSMGLQKLKVISRQETKDKYAHEEGPRATPMREILLQPDATEEQKYQVWRRDMPKALSDKEVMDIMRKAEARLLGSVKKQKIKEFIERVKPMLSSMSTEQKRKVYGLLESALKDKADYEAKTKALQDMEREPGHDKEAIRQRKLDLDKEARAKGLAEASFDKEEFRRHMKDLEAREELRKTDPVSAKALDLRGQLPQQAKKKPEDDSMSINDPRHPGYAYTEIGQHKVDEGDVVQFPKKHRGDISDMHSCPKCGGDTQGGKYMGHQVQVCMPCKQVYLPPNSGIDQQGNKIKEAIGRRGILKGLGAAMAAGAAGKASAIAGAFPTPSHQQAMYKAAADSNAAQARADAAAKAKADAERLKQGTADIERLNKINFHGGKVTPINATWDGDSDFMDVDGTKYSMASRMPIKGDEPGNMKLVSTKEGRQVYMWTRNSLKGVVGRYFYPAPAGSSQINEFAPSDDGDNGQEDMFFKYAKLWYNGNLQVQQRIEEVLAQAGWEIGELESEEGGAFIVKSGDENGDTYMGWSAEDLGGQLNEFAPGNGDDGLPYAEYQVYQCNPLDQFDWIGGPLYQTDSMGMAHKYAYEQYVKHRPKAFMIWQERSQGSRGNYGVKGESDQDDVNEDYIDEK